MLKKIMIYFSDELYNDPIGQSFFERMKMELSAGRFTELICASLTGGLIRQENDSKESRMQYAPWQLIEQTEEYIGENGAEVIFLTDLPYMYTKAAKQNVAALPIALAEDKMDYFYGAEYLLGGLEDVDYFYLNRIYERYHNIPWQIIQTERTIVREMTVEDVGALYEIYKEPSITKYTDPLFVDPEEEKAYTKEYIEKVYRFLEFGIWIVEDKKIPGKIIGRAGLSMRDGFDEPELGYIIAVPYQRQGYALEVCKAIISYAEEQFAFEKLRIVMTKDNEASHKLCEKLGFSFDCNISVDGREMEQYELLLIK